MADAETALAAFDSHAAARLGAQSPALGPMNAVLLRTESAASSQIEDLTVGARQLALAVLDESRSGNARAVVANVRTMEAALRLAAELDLEAILAMHEELLEGTVDACRLRRQLVWVGRSGLSPLGALHVAPEAEDDPASMQDLVEFLARDDLPVLLHAALAHAQFETVHPFTDGNGRTGRALVHALLSGKGLLTTTAPVSAGLPGAIGRGAAPRPGVEGAPAADRPTDRQRSPSSAHLRGAGDDRAACARAARRRRRPAGGHRPLPEPGMAAAGVLRLLDAYAAQVRREG